jgi:hypothetical protein
VDRDDVTSVGLTAIGIVAGTVARAVALGGRLVAAGLGTIENALRAGEDSSGPGTRGGRSPSPDRSHEGPDEAPGAGFAPLSEPAFEPADGITPSTRPARSLTRRSSAGAAGRTAPGPRPAKRATAKSLPPNLRPVQAREPEPEPAPVKGAAGAAEVAGVTPAKGTAKKTTTKATAKKATAKTAAEPAKAAAETSPATEPSAAKTSAARKNVAKKAAASKRAAKKAPADQAPTDQAPTDQAPADQAPTDQAPADQAPTDQAPADQAPTDQAPADETPATDSAESAHTRPEGTLQP